MKRKTLSCSMLLIAFIFCIFLFPSPSKAAKKYNWKISHIRPAGFSVDKDCHWLADTLSEKTSGRINISVFPANQLGDYTVVQERIGLGAIEMSLACLSSERDPRIQIIAMPYLCKNWDDVAKIYAPDGFVVQNICKFMEKQNIHIISSWPVYFGGIGTTKEAAEPGNPDVSKNVKIRIPTQKIYQLSSEALGFQSTPIPWSDTFAAMQTGIVDGIIGGGGEAYYANLRDLIKYYYPYNDHVEMWFLYMNKDLWDSLSEEDKDLVTSAGKTLEENRYKKVKEEEKEIEDKMAAFGIKIVPLSDAQLSACQSKIRKEVWPKLREDIGPEIVDQLIQESESE